MEFLHWDYIVQGDDSLASGKKCNSEYMYLSSVLYIPTEFLHYINCCAFPKRSVLHFNLVNKEHASKPHAASLAQLR